MKNRLTVSGLLQNKFPSDTATVKKNRKQKKEYQIAVQIYHTSYFPKSEEIIKHHNFVIFFLFFFLSLFDRYETF